MLLILSGYLIKSVYAGIVGGRFHSSSPLECELSGLSELSLFRVCPYFFTFVVSVSTLYGPIVVPIV